jgi:hypothetical protein
MKYLFAIALCFGCLVDASSIRNPLYSELAPVAEWHSRTNTVYIWPWVKTPGAYPHKKGMTIADLVAAAGGVVRDARNRNHPESYILPKTIWVRRPTPKDPDPARSVFVLTLDWSKTNGGISECKFELQPGDFVGVDMSGCVP